jgi:hypothetical protein
VSHHIFARRRPWLGVLVLLAFLATLVPAQRASAQAEPGHIELTPEEVDDAIWGDWLTTFPDVEGTPAGRQIEHHLFQSLVGSRFDNPNGVNTDQIFKQADALYERYLRRLGPGAHDAEVRARLSPREVAEAMVTAALETPAFRASAKTVYGELRDHAAKVVGYARDDDLAYWEAYTGDDALVAAARTLKQEQAKKMLKRAKANPEFAKQYDKRFAQANGVKLADFLSESFDLKTFLAEHPEIGVPQEVQNAIKPDGSLEIEVAALDKLTKDALGKINAAIDDTQQTIGAITNEQGELVDFESDAEKRQKAQALAEAKYAENQRKLEAASSVVFIVSSLVGLKNPERGRQIAVIGQSALQIGEALNGWLLATAGMKGLSKLGSLSTVAMTGNILGAVMNVVSLFGPQQPTPEQMILEEIGKLRQQVDQLRTEMHTRFDRVDAQLTTIYKTMHDRFNQIDIQLGKISGKLDEVQQSLLNLGIQLDRMERNNVEYLDALGRRPLREAINGALGYRERTNAEMPYQPDFVAYENTFHTWGTINAFDALNAGPSERNYSDAQLLAELSAAPLDANLNYLNGWLQAHGLPPFATKRLPSPRDWAFASRAYAALGQDWPQHFARIGAGRQASLDAVGKELEQALANISTIQTPSGPQANGPLWNGLTAYYNAKLEALDRALLDKETSFVTGVQTELGRPLGFDLYGGLDQPLQHQPTDFATMTCGGAYIDQIRVAAPRNLKNMVPAYNRYALADYLGLNQTTVCWYPELVDKFETCQGGGCEAYGFVTVQIVVKSPLGEVARRTFRGYPAKWNSEVRQLVVSQWATIYQPKIESELAGVTPPAADTAAITSKLATRLVELQRSHAGRVLNELSGLTSGPLRAKAVELAGAKKLLESFITLGFGEAVSNDDVLRSLLFSKEALIDQEQVALAYATPISATLQATAAISEAQLLLNPRVKLHETGAKRGAALSGLLFDYLGSISTGNYREDSALIAGARFDMAMSRALANSNAPVPPGQPGQRRVVFLPLLRR